MKRFTLILLMMIFTLNGFTQNSVGKRISLNDNWQF